MSTEYRVTAPMVSDIITDSATVAAEHFVALSDARADLIVDIAMLLEDGHAFDSDGVRVGPDDES